MPEQLAPALTWPFVSGCTGRLTLLQIAYEPPTLGAEYPYLTSLIIHRPQFIAMPTGVVEIVIEAVVPAMSFTTGAGVDFRPIL